MLLFVSVCGCHGWWYVCRGCCIIDVGVVGDEVVCVAVLLLALWLLCVVVVSCNVVWLLFLRLWLRLFL